MSEFFTQGIEHKGFKSSHVGKIPVDWEVIKLEGLCQKITDGAHKTPKYLPSGIPFLRVTDLKNKEIFSGEIKYISYEEHSDLIKRCNPQIGDILFSKNGTIGSPRIIDWEGEFSIFVSLALLKIQENKINPDFLVQLLDSPIIHFQIKQRSKQGTVTNLHLEEIREFLIPLPLKEEQQKIASILTSIDRNIEQKQSKLTQTKNLKKSLMADLLTGRVRVKP